MKIKTRTLTSFVSLFLICIMIVSISGVQNVKAVSGGIISLVSVRFNIDDYHYNTAYTEGYVCDCIQYGNPCYIQCEGLGYYSTVSKTHYDYLCKRIGNYWRPREYSTDYLSIEELYCVYINEIKPKEGFRYPESVRNLGHRGAMSKDLEDFNVSVNGIIRDDVVVQYLAEETALFIFIPLGKPSTEYVDPSMTIKGSADPMEPTHTREFSVFYVAPFKDKTYEWSVSGNKSNKTTIVDGLLTIGSNETADSITVKATSVADPTVYDTVTVPITYEIKPIDKVTISPKEAVVYTGNTTFFSSEVEGEQLNKSLNWTVTGATSADTFISDEGALHVAMDETAGELTVTASSVVFPDKKDTAKVTVKQTKILDEIAVEFDLDGYHFIDGYGYTENDVDQQIKNGDPSPITVTSDGCLNKGESDGLRYLADGYWSSVISVDDVLSPEKDYAIFLFELVPDEGYAFPDSIKNNKVISGDLDDIVFKVNGKVQDDAEIHYVNYNNSIYVYIPIGKPKIDLAKEETVIEGIADKTYTGEPVEQNLKVSVTRDGVKTDLVKDTDYVLSYENNVEVGAATVSVKGIGEYTGTVTRTFKIKPAPTEAPKPTDKPDPTKAATVTLKLNKTTTNIVCGATETLKATLKGSSSKITWKTSDKNIAAVDANGKITAKSAGTVTITATAAGKTAKCSVTVLYKDVTDSKDFWFAPTNYLTAKGVVKGYDNQTLFKPANECSRAQMVTFLYRLQGQPKTKATSCTFTDVKEGEYYYKPVIWAVEKGITTGYSDGTFKPQNVCTRAQTVTFLWRMANKPAPQSKTCSFTDVKKTDYFYNAVIWASEKKIVAGYDNGTFKPNDKCLRRQMVTFLYKYDKYVNGKG